MNGPVTLARALADARGQGLDRLDAQLLLVHLLQQPRSWLLAHDDAPLTPAQARDFDALCRRRAAGEPLAYVTGEREFRGLRLQVSPAVLVPRPETEALVDWGLALIVGQIAPQVADLGTGSGAIALAVAQARSDARVTAVEASTDALAVARANGGRLGLAVDWRAGDWWQPLAGRQFDLVLSNPPYVAAGDPHLAALRHEPATALVSGDQGLDDLRRVIAGAPDHLAPGAALLLEHGHDQAEAVQALLRAAGFTDVETRPDLAGLPRCSGGRWAPGNAPGAGGSAAH